MALLGQFSANGGDPPGDWPDDQAVSLRLMGHELRTPLNAIIGFADIIADQLYGEVGDARYVAHARMIRESGLRMLDVVSRLVELSRLEAGVADLHLRETPALEPVHDAMEAVAAAAADASVEVVVEADDPELRVVCDPRGLSSALVNLLSNAIAFSPPGPAGEPVPGLQSQVRLRVTRQGLRILFEIRDQGPGVPQEWLSRILRPFAQSQNAMVRQTTGAGLGLPLTLRLCEAMGGELKLSSPPQSGLVAQIWLPAAD
jgi:two-component system cell cycle sensor histidine kinase PleC